MPPRLPNALGLNKPINGWSNVMNGMSESCDCCESYGYCANCANCAKPADLRHSYSFLKSERVFEYPLYLGKCSNQYHC